MRKISNTIKKKKNISAVFKLLPYTFSNVGFSGSSLDAVDFQIPLPMLIDHYDDWKTQ